MLMDMAGIGHDAFPQSGAFVSLEGLHYQIPTPNNV